MMTFIRNMLRPESKKPTTQFSAFFNTASSGEKKEVLKRVVRKANEEQRALMERNEKSIKTT